jgi:choloylglycine hydrolase
VSSYEILAYILTNFATIDEVKAGLLQIKVNRSPHPVFKGVVPLHFTLHDASGKSLVVEYIGGQLQMTDNPTHVMTNAPAIDWHFNNVSLYGGISAQPVPPLSFGKTTFSPPSTGNNTIGLPADFSSPSRFVRAAFLSQAAPQSKTAQEGVNTVFHIMNQFDIPPGAIRTSAKSESGGGIDGFEVTEWTTVMDTKNQVLYVRTYDNSQTRKVSFASLDLNAKDIRTLPLTQTENAVDMVK